MMQIKDPDVNYVIACAEENGIKVDKNTVMDFHFMAEVMRAMNRKLQRYDCSKCDKGHSSNYAICSNCGEYKEGENK